MAEYMNPFAGLPNPQNYPDNPFMREYQTQQRQQAVQPFMDMAQQSMGMDLQKQQMQNQEFASPEARGARMAGFGATTAKAKFDAAKAMADLERMPQEQKLKFAEIGNKLSSEEAKPHQEMFTELAGLSDILEQTPEQHRPMVYKQWADRTQQKLGRALPEKFQNYTPQILQESQAIKFGLVMTPAHQQKLGELKQTGANSMGVAQQNARSASEVAKINQAGAMDRTKFAAAEGSPKNQAQILFKMKQTLTNPKSTDEEKEQAKFILNSQATEKSYELIEKFTRKDKELLMMGGPTAAAAQARIDKAEKQIRTDVFNAYGIGEGAGSGGRSLTNMEHKELASRPRGQGGWGAYEPEKYDYGINPSTGEFARKPKGN